MQIQKPRGTYDLIPTEVVKRRYVEETTRKVFSNFNFSEIRTPTFENTQLFKRGIGEETDIVSKEMYSFSDGEFTLKPEMTASVIRSYLENSLYNESPLQKLYYISNMFRAERPQKGRYREFSQFGAEAIGSGDYSIDVEMIVLADSILKALGLKDYTITLNTLGTIEERKIYLDNLKAFLKPFESQLSETSKVRLEKNPLRILDTKNPEERKILENAPALYDFLNDESKNHFQNILSSLDALKIKYVIDYKLVRGLDYYTSTAFEFISAELGAQSTILGGGRYDVLVEMLGGKPTPAIGFAAGIERILILLEEKAKAGRFTFPEDNKLNLYIVNAGLKDTSRIQSILTVLRTMGIKCESDFLSRSVKSQMKEANKYNAEYTIVLGENEITSQKCKLKRMADSKEIEADINRIYDDIMLFEELLNKQTLANNAD
ncbi:MAG: histidine--tRNA ligase [Bacteroidetes bacterium]|nr:histidine--tRNA ligase [Bacteroidota bacterium]